MPALTGSSESLQPHPPTSVDRRAVEEPPQPRVIVGVDGTAANWSAVLWATAEARDAGRPLLLVACASSDSAPPAEPEAALERERSERLTADLLEDVRRRIATRVGDVSTRVTAGEPGHALVEVADQRDLLVVGKRRGHPWSQAVLGSIAVAVSGRCSGPVVIVPEDWSVDEHRAQHVVVGIEGERDGTVLDVAFERAERLGVGLVVVHAGAAALNLARLVAPWERKHPEVHVAVHSHPLTPAVSLLGAATDAQVLVVGRLTSTEHSGALGLGSTTRKLLHHASCPVMVVPHVSGLVAGPDSLVFDEGDLPEF